MKKLVLLIVLLIIQGNVFSQKMNAAVKGQYNTTVKQSKTIAFSHDLAVIQPLININDSNGGYYSQYYGTDFLFMYCGAKVKNVGTFTATHVHLELKLRDSFNTILYTYYSDTITQMNPGDIATVNIPGQITFQPPIFNSTQLLFIAMSDSVDENPGNDQEIVSFPILTYWDWTYASRSIYMTTSQEIDQSAGFHSGDFLGFTLSVQQSHTIYYLMIDIAEPWLDSLIMTAMIYKDGQVIDSSNVYLPSPPQAGWVMSDIFWTWQFLEPGYLYYVGVKISYASGTHLKIGTDTSAYHNFSAESIANIGGSWLTLNYVPLIQLVCDPEGIDELGHHSPARVFPNPVKGSLSLENVGGAGIEIYDITGKLVLTDTRTASSRKIDVSNLSSGIYLLKMISQKSVDSRKIIIK